MDKDKRIEELENEIRTLNERFEHENAAHLEMGNRFEESESKMRNFIEQSLEGIVIVNDDARIIEWNHKQERITGIPRKEALGKYCWEPYGSLVSQDNKEELTGQIRTYMLSFLKPLEDGQATFDESELTIRRTYKTQYIDMITFQIKLADKYYLGQLVRDVTEQKKVDLELKQYRAQLENMVELKTEELIAAKVKAEESDHLKSAFLANMSHEIRTPLNAIVGFLHFINSDNITPIRRNEYINIVNNSCRQLVKLIDDIIDISKIEAHQMTIRPIKVEINEMMKEIHSVFEALLKSRKQTNIELILDDSEFIDSCCLNIDRSRLRQVLDNLLGNAVKYTHKGFIRFGYRQSSPGVLEFVVEDSGIGLSPSQFEIIFERFRQVDIDAGRVQVGTGLGLTISRNLVQLMGGKMWVESTEGVGSSFYFTIPL